jgi:uncharacterized protein
MKAVTKLIGREYETAKLDNILASSKPEFLAVYGRRRVGKTFLIRQHLKNNIVFDFTGKKDGLLNEQLENFFDEYLKRATGKKEKQAPTSWQEAFKYLANYAIIKKRRYKYAKETLTHGYFAY